MNQYKLTFFGAALAIIVLFAGFIIEIDLFEIVVEFLESLEHLEVDELIIPIFIVFVFAFMDQIRRRKLQEMEYERVKIYKAMLSSTHHILNNFLNQMQLFKLTAEGTPGFDSEILSLYDGVIKDASTQIDALGSITNIDEASIQKSVAPKSKVTSAT